MNNEYLRSLTASQYFHAPSTNPESNSPRPLLAAANISVTKETINRAGQMYTKGHARTIVKRYTIK